MDVRTANEFATGHAKNAINISVDLLVKNLAKLKNKNQPIFTCCASGKRSAIAKRILISRGYTEVFNGGTWKEINQFTNN